MLKFAAAAIVAAFVVLFADRWTAQFYELGAMVTANDTDQMIVANIAYKAFTWAYSEGR